MAAVAHLHLPEKRLNDLTAEEDPSEKRQKLENTITELPRRTYCSICDVMTSHSIVNCPYRARAIGRCCLLCDAPCKQNEEGEHGRNIVVMMKRCSYCLTPGDHWVEDCPISRRVNDRVNDFAANYPAGHVFDADF